MNTIAVIGAGVMGQGIAWTFARSNCNVVQITNSLNDENRKRIELSYKKLSRIDKIMGLSCDDYSVVLSRISLSTDISAATSAEFVIECVVEDVTVKKNVFISLLPYIKEGVALATNTSSLSITELSSVLQDYGKNLVGVHFFNPAPVMELVEIVGGINSDKNIIIKWQELIKNINKKSVIVEEYPGFIVNRLIMPMINEAVNLLDNGIASIKEIDMAMKLGANHPLGPLELADMIGIDVVYAILETLYNETGESRYKPAYTLKKMKLANRLGKKTKRGFY